MKYYDEHLTGKIDSQKAGFPYQGKVYNLKDSSTKLSLLLIRDTSCLSKIWQRQNPTPASN